MTTILVIATCLVLNALLSAIEMAFVSVGKPELRQKSRTGDKKAFELLRLRENPERTLSVLQIGITLVGAVSAAVGGAGADEKLAPILQARWGLAEGTSEIIAIIFVVLPLTYFSVVLGELVPKTFALKQPLRVSINGLPLLKFGELFLSPLVSFLESSTQLALKLFSKVTPAAAPASSVETHSVDIAGLSMTHKQLVFNLVNIETKRASDVLLPWDDVDVISYSDSTADVIARMVQCRHTRLPILNGTEIKGILHSKEFLSYLSAGDENWQKIIRPPLMILPTLPLLSLLRIMQSTKTHIAIVQTPESEPLGIVTLEDILEEVIGEIYDEDEDGRLKKIMSQRIQELQIKNRKA